MAHFKTMFLFASVAVFLAILEFSELEPTLAKGLALFALVAMLWVTEALHISITALLVPLLAIALGIDDVGGALSSFAHPILFLFMGGFVLAGALHHHGVDRYIAIKLLSLTKGSLLLSSWAVFGLTAFLSMWISNTATVAIMVPLVLGLLSNLDATKNKSTYLYFLLGTAYSGSIGGMATVIGSPPNAIAASALNMTFLEWMKYGVPMVLVALPVLAALLYWMLKPPLKHELVLSGQSVSLNRDSVKVLLIFLVTIVGWVMSSQLAAWLNISGNADAVVALAAIVLIGSSQTLSWKEMSNSINWGVLILFGGGITLSMVLAETGGSIYLADAVKGLITDMPFMVFVFTSALFVIFLTELVSNTASAALVIPIFSTLAVGLNFDPVVMVFAVAFSASCAFMLPVATPPNALVYGTGYVAQNQMMRIGVLLNLVMAFVISTFVIAVL